MLLDSRGGPNHLGNTCDAPIIADEAYGALHLHPQFFFLGHFSKWVPPGSRRVGLERIVAGGRGGGGGAASAEGGAGGVYNLTGEVAYGRCEPGPPEAVALRRPDDGALVLIALNCADVPATIRVELGGAEAGRGAAVRGTVPPHAIQTYVLSLSGGD